VAFLFSFNINLDAVMKTILALFLGIVLIVAGTAVLTYNSFTITTAARQLLQVGPVEAGTQQSNWTVTVPPLLGAILLAGGTVLVFVIAIFKRAPKQEDNSKSSAEIGTMAQNRK